LFLVQARAILPDTPGHPGPSQWVGPTAPIVVSTAGRPTARDSSTPIRFPALPFFSQDSHG
jgi:hypothetical protein